MQSRTDVVEVGEADERQAGTLAGDDAIKIERRPGQSAVLKGMRRSRPTRRARKEESAVSIRRKSEKRSRSTKKVGSSARKGREGKRGTRTGCSPHAPRISFPDSSQTKRTCWARRVVAAPGVRAC